MIKKCNSMTLMLAVWLSFAVLLSGLLTEVKAEQLFHQGEGYEAGAYDRHAVQPTASNWNRQSKYTGPVEAEVWWSFPTEGEVYSTPVIGADHTLYVGSYDGILYALNSETGQLKWSYATDFAIASSPAIGADGTIYVGSGDHHLYALDPHAVDENDRVKWVFETGDSIYTSPAIGADGTIYVTSYDGWIYALDPHTDHDTERELWSYEIGGPIYSSPVIGRDGTLYAGSHDGIFYALDPHADDDERVKWSIGLNSGVICSWGPCPISSTPAIGADGTIYVASSEGYVYALDPEAADDQRVKWRHDMWGAVVSSPAIGADGTVYVNSSGGGLYAFDPHAEDAQDRVKWVFDTDWINRVHSSPVIGSDGTIYVGWSDGKLYALEPDENSDRLQEVWSIEIDDKSSIIESSPIIGADGTIYIGSNDHHLYAIGRKRIDGPLSLNAVPDDGAVKLSWDRVDESAGYDVYMYEGAEAPNNPTEWSLVNEGRLTETEFHISNLNAGQLYWFTVKAVEEDGLESHFSDHVSAIPYVNVMEASAPHPIHVEKGLELANLNLPTEAIVQLSDRTERNLAIIWDLVNTDYNPGQTGTYTISGEFQLPEHVNNPGHITTELIINVLPSSNAKLVSIELNGDRIPEFQPEIYSYDVRFPYETEQVTVTAATYELESTYIIRGENPRPLRIGENEIEIHVTAENGDDVQYTIHVNRRQDEEAPNWSANSRLNIENVFESSVRLAWPAATDHTAVTGYRIFVNGIQILDGSVDRFDYSDTDRAYRYRVANLKPSTDYEFTVKAYDAAGNVSEPGLSNTVRTLQRTPRGWFGDYYAGPASENASLNALEVWADGKPIDLEPLFEKDILSYSARTEAERIELRTIAEHAGAKVIWQDEPIHEATEIELLEGENIILLTVQAENGSTLTYTLTIERNRMEDEPKQPDLPTIEFSDIAGHWAEISIMHAAALGIVNGYPDGTFQPNRSVTRAEFTVMLINALKLEHENSSLHFSDHDQIGSWAVKAVAQAVEAGIISGYEDGTFRPNQLITRAEMATMIAGAITLPTVNDLSTGFADDPDIPAWAKAAVAALHDQGLVSGRGENLFEPNESATRAEVTVMIVRMLDRK